LLFLDNLKAQTTEEFRNRFEEGNVKVWWLPKNTTDLVQPVDRRLAQALKIKVGRLLDDKIAADTEFANRWLNLSDGKFTVSDCRILLTHLVSKAWRELCSERDFQTLGWETGCVMPRSGVDRQALGIKPIHIDGLQEPYTFQTDELETLESPTEKISEDAQNPTSSLSEPPLPSLAEAEPARSKKRRKARVPKAAAEIEAREASCSIASEQSASDEDDGDISDESSVLSSGSNNDAESQSSATSTESAFERRLARISDKHSKRTADGKGNKMTFDIGAAKESSTVCPAEEGASDNDEVDMDLNAISNELADDTSELCATTVPDAPAGFSLVPRPTVFPAISSLINKKVYWYVPLRRDGTAGWVIAEVAGGPVDPASAALGNTVRLSCTTRLDKNTPQFLIGKRVQHSVAFTLDNYGSRWMVLK